MSTLSDRGRDALVRRLKETAGVSVIYARRGANTLTLTAVPGQTLATSTEPPGKILISARDYLVAVEDLVDANGARAKPAIGDRITETISGVATTFEVQDPQDGTETAVRYCSQWRSMWRLHAKAV